MELSVIVVVFTGALLFFGFILTLAIYSRRNEAKHKSQNETE